MVTMHHGAASAARGLGWGQRPTTKRASVYRCGQEMIRQPGRGRSSQVLSSPAARAHPCRVVYAIAHGGGGVAAWSTTAGCLPEDIELRAIRLPGRELRHGERPYEDAASAVDEIADALANDAATHDLPFVVVGSCSGALLGRSALSRLEAVGSPSVGLMAIRQPPPDGVASERISDLARDDLRQWLRTHGMMPAELVDDDDLFALFEPAIRADLRLGEDYRPEDEPINAPIIALWSRSDGMDPGSYAAWARQTTRSVILAEAPAGADLLREPRELLAPAIVAAFQPDHEESVRAMRELSRTVDVLP